jgi:hypothetical protein
VTSRHRPIDPEPDWLYKRNSQSNFDTILQAINLRSQPEIVIQPKQMKTMFGELKFGYVYEESVEVNYWTFQFTVSHSSVFNDGISELGALYSDCNGVPMIKCGTEWDKLSNILDTSDELRNIYFEAKNNE